MSDIKSTIRIEDGFTEPLQELTKQTYHASEAVDSLKESVSELSESLNKDLSESAALEYKLHKSLNRSFDLLQKTAITIGGNLKKVINNTISSAKDRAAGYLTKPLTDELSKYDDELTAFAERRKKVIEQIKKNSTISEDAKAAAIERANTLTYRNNARELLLMDKSQALKNEIKLLNEEQDAFKLIGQASKKRAEEAVSNSKKIIESKANEIKQELNAGGIKGVIKDRASNLQYKAESTYGRAYNKLFDEGSIGNKYKTIYGRTGGLEGSLNVAKAAKEDIKVASENLFTQFKDKSFKGINNGITKAWQGIGGTEAWEIAKDFGKEFGSVAITSIVQNLALSFVDKLRDKIIGVFQSARTAIQNSLDELDLSNKLSSMWGKAGDNARNKMYDLANELGEDAGRVSELAARAAYQGIGTKDFTRMMRLSDKIGKLSLGETTESAASNLLSNIKSGHDAGSFAQMLGGGQRMERKLRRAGFERALNRGDVSKALEIAEKITEQAGLTDEKYQKATKSLSENYKRIENVVSNIRRKISAIYVEELAPAVQKVRDFIESDSFRTAMAIVEKGVRQVGKFVSGLIQDLIDWLPYLGALFGVGLVAKSFLFIKNLGGMLGLLGMMKTALIKIFTWLGATKIAGALKAITKQQILILAKQKAIAAVKVVGPWLLFGAAIGGALKLVHHFYGEGKDFVDWLKGMIAGAWQLSVNVFQNVIALFERVGKHPEYLFLQLKKYMILISRFFKDSRRNIQDSLFGDFAPYKLEDKFSSMLGIKTGEEKKQERQDKLDEIERKLAEIESVSTDFVPVWEGVREAIDSNGKTLFDGMTKGLKDLLGLNKKQTDDEDEIATNSGEIRRSMGQEEELRWLKAFSDRQIMSSLSNITSNSNTNNFYGVPGPTMSELGRRSVKTIPPRPAA
jgi:hypothetical protein